MIYGYARVSTAMQGRDGNSLEEQVAALTAYGCQEIIQEAFTGKTMERPAFTALLDKLKESDTLVVTKLDRFARTAIDGVQTVRNLFERGVKVHILNMGLVENTLTGNLILTVMLAFAEGTGDGSVFEEVSDTCIQFCLSGGRFGEATTVSFSFSCAGRRTSPVK